MDPLTRLQENNEKHQLIRDADNKESHFVLVNGLLPLLIFYYEFASAEKSLSLEPWLAMITTYIFTLLLTSFSRDLVLRHWLRIPVLIIGNVWFCFFWIMENDSKMAFLPLAIVFVLWRKWFIWTLFRKLRKNV